MSDEGEKSCPLCAEEMDLTDQQLRPCKCGYEICVWCWHHIMDMAEKDETEGRCPACRTPYNKEKIFGTTAKCDRPASDLNGEKKLKSHKGKGKISEGRKQLSTARVIQRNLVYVVGLPLNFADEDLLQRREYFGQYGKVLKVSISRTVTGSIQQFPNSTCSVYITYSKEEEAVRCIQMVHGFSLDGRPLRACFGTTKYCHAWLRNVPCTNPDCLYLHEIGSQEDSFTKDEVISAYTRSRIQQVTSSSNSIQRRSGNVLPPPGDEYCNNSPITGKPMVKTATNTNQNSSISGRTSPNSSSGRSAALPAGASWGTRSSSSQPLLRSTANPNGSLDQKTDVSNGPVAFSKASQSQVSSLQNDIGKINVPNEESTIALEKTKTETVDPVKKETDADGIIVSDTSMASVYLASVPSSSQLHSPPRTKSLLSTLKTFDSIATSSGLASIDCIDSDVENMCSDMLSLNIKENWHLQNDVEHIRERSICQTSENVMNTTDVVQIASVHSNLKLGKPDQITELDMSELDDDLLSFHKQRITDTEIASSRAPNFSNALKLKHANSLSPVFDNADGFIGIGFDRQVVGSNNLAVSTSNFPSVNLKNIFNNGAGDSNLFLRKEKMSPVGRHEPEVGSSAIDIGESSIISNILSMNFNSWDEPATSPQSMAKFLGETNSRQGSTGVPGSWKTQNSSQSRFSFAREDTSHLPHPERSTDHENFLLFGHNYSINGLHLEKSFCTNGLPVSNAMEQDYFTSNNSHISSTKLSVSRPQVAAPPGFSVPSRAAPPGFTSHGRTEQIFESPSGNYALDTSSLFRNQYQIPSSGDTFTNSDIEFMDPAILAVGKGTAASGIHNAALDIRSNFPPQFNAYDEVRFQSILQRSMPQHNNQTFRDPVDSVSTRGDAYEIPSRIVEHMLSNNHSFSQFTVPQSRNGITSTGQWDGWIESQNVNRLGTAELLRSERLGFNNKLYGCYDSYEESRLRIPGSDNVYSGAYGN